MSLQRALGRLAGEFCGAEVPRKSVRDSCVLEDDGKTAGEGLDADSQREAPKTYGGVLRCESPPHLCGDLVCGAAGALAGRYREIPREMRGQSGLLRYFACFERAHKL